MHELILNGDENIFDLVCYTEQLLLHISYPKTDYYINKLYSS